MQIKQFNLKLFHIFSSGLEDFQDVGTCISAIMDHYGVQFKPMHELDYDKEITCKRKHNGDVASLFFDEINTVAHDKFERFNTSCTEFMDYSGSTFAIKLNHTPFRVKVYSMKEGKLTVNVKTATL